MADTGERRPIVGRANAREAELVRESKKMISEERSTEKANDAVFGSVKKSSRRLTEAVKKGSYARKAPRK